MDRFTSLFVRFGLASVLVLLILPVWTTSTPPMLDYPNHLARQYILAHLDDSPFLGRYYQTNWHLLPNLAMDLMVQTLAQVMPVQTAGRVFLSLVIGLLALAPLALSRALHGRISPLAVLGLLFVNNQILGEGFVNYLFATALALVTFAFWIRQRASLSMWAALVGFPAAAVAMYVSHLSGWGVYLICLASYEFGLLVRRLRHGHTLLGTIREQRSIYLSLFLQVLVPMLLFVLVTPHGSGHEPMQWGTLDRKLSLVLHFFQFLVLPHAWRLDHTLALALTGLIPALLLLRVIRIEPTMLWPLAGLTGAALLLPMSLMGGWGVDHRLLVPLGLLLAGSLKFANAMGERLRQAAWIGLIAVAVLHTMAVIRNWHQADRVYAQELAALERIEPGSRLYFAFGLADGPSFWPAPRYHLPTLAVIRKQAFVPYLFTNPTQQPLLYTESYREIMRKSRGSVLQNGQSPNWGYLIRHYDYLLLHDPKQFSEPPPSHLVPLYQGKDFVLYATPRALDAERPPPSTP